jgi:hypothetical protein
MTTGKHIVPTCYFNILILIIILTQLNRKSPRNQQYTYTKYTPHVHLYTRTSYPHSHTYISINFIARIFSHLCFYSSLFYHMIDIQLDTTYEQGTQVLLKCVELGFR